MTGVVPSAAVALQTTGLVEEFVALLVAGVARLLGYAGISLAVAGVAAVGYRWYLRERIPPGLAALLGVGAVAVALNTEELFAQVLGGGTGDPFTPAQVAFNVVVFAVSAAVSPVGRRVGDTVAADLFAVSGAREFEAEVSSLVRSVGRVTAMELPPADDIGDMENYDPVESAVKEVLGGKTLVFPRRLTVAELRDRLVTRLKEDHGVGYVDVELDEDGEVSYLALGSRVSGIGPTLGPGTAAVAIEADPANSAGPGDLVQIWRTEQEPERVATAELRATAGDVVTVALDETDAADLHADATYRLVTLPASPQADREFSALLRAADETMAVVTVAEGSDLAGRTVGDVDPTVVAIHPAGGGVEAIPPRTRALGAGDVLYALGRPEALRRLELAATERATGAEAEAGGDAAGV